jgi:hydrogenase maturation protease
VNGKILVACIGNIFLGDDAFGVEVAQRLANHRLPERVTVVDFGIRSYDLAYSIMQGWDLVILVDALPQGGKPGTLYVFEPRLPSKSENSISLDAHTMNPVSVLQLVRALGGSVDRLLVVGCEPEHLEPRADGNVGLSPGVQGALDEAVRMIEGLIARARRDVLAA